MFSLLRFSKKLLPVLYRAVCTFVIVLYSHPSLSAVLLFVVCYLSQLQLRNIKWNILGVKNL